MFQVPAGRFALAVFFLFAALHFVLLFHHIQIQHYHKTFHLHFVQCLISLLPPTQHPPLSRFSGPHRSVEVHGNCITWPVMSEEARVPSCYSPQ